MANAQVAQPTQGKVVSRVQWSQRVASHLGQYLNATQLTGLFDLWKHGQLHLWGVFNNGQHTGTIATRFDSLIDGTRHLVLAHCGGDWVRHMDVLDPFMEGVAKKTGCHAMRMDAQSPVLARLFRRRWRFHPFEFSVIRPIKRGNHEQ